MSDFLCIVMTSATTGTLLSWQPYTLGCMERSKAVLGCMVDRYHNPVDTSFPGFDCIRYARKKLGRYYKK